MEPLSIYELTRYPTLQPLFQWRKRYEQEVDDETFLNQLLQIARLPGRAKLPHNGALTIPGDYRTVLSISPNVEVGLLRIRLPWSTSPTPITTAERPRPRIYIPCLIAYDDPTPLYGLPAATPHQARRSCHELKEWVEGCEHSQLSQ